MHYHAAMPPHFFVVKQGLWLTSINDRRSLLSQGYDEMQFGVLACLSTHASSTILLQLEHGEPIVLFVSSSDGLDPRRAASEKFC